MDDLYKEIQQDGGKAIFRSSDGAWIPCDPNNTDYQEYLKWKEKQGKSES